MIQRPQKILPVVNEKGQAIGVITKNDILKSSRNIRWKNGPY
jgi:predicted transcriptional regulator